MTEAGRATQRDRVVASYDAVADRYAQEVGDELDDKPIDRALYACLAELVGAGAKVGDVGCGPGHVTKHLADLGLDVVGVDPSPGMIAVARRRYPRLAFRLASLTDLREEDGAWSGAVAPYSLIHLAPTERSAAYAELSRAIAPGGWLLVSFHVSTSDQPPGSVRHLDDWWGHNVDLDFHFLDPGDVETGLTAARFTTMSRTEREPWPDVEAQSRRCYLLARRQ
ncbi:MAG: methyltransferase domain-containing protein [Actinobacteria bacterium]|nr:methyltransferase domain-containing protein [Actinomycetota bacterium]